LKIPSISAEKTFNAGCGQKVKTLKKVNLVLLHLQELDFQNDIAELKSHLVLTVGQPFQN
jgi:hypothetical protein